MHFKIFLQQLRRGTKKSLLYVLLLTAVTAFFVMSINLYRNSTANLQSAEETYTTIALMELYGEVNNKGELVEPFTEEHIGNVAVSVKGYDFSDVVEASGVIDWDLRKKYAAHIEGEIALNGDNSWIATDSDIIRFKLKGDEPIEIPIDWEGLWEGPNLYEDFVAQFEVIDNAADGFNYHSLFGEEHEGMFQIDMGGGYGISIGSENDCEEYREQVRQLNRSEESDKIILYPGVEYIACTWSSSGWVETEPGSYQYAGIYESDYRSTGKVEIDPSFNDIVAMLPYPRFYPNFPMYGQTVRVYYSARGEGRNFDMGVAAGQPFPIHRWEDVQNDPELKKYFDDAWEGMNIQQSVFNVELTDDIEGVPVFHVGGAYLKDGRYITSEEYENGAKVCMVSDKMAELQGWEIGDKLPMDFFVFDKFPHNNQTGGSGWLSNQAYWEEDSEFFYSDTYEIVGIFSQTPTTGNSGIAPSTLAMPWNTIYLPQNAVENTRPVEESNVSGYLLTIWLENGSVDAFLKDMEALGLTETQAGRYNPNFVFYDQGYSQIQPGLEAMHSTAELLLVLSAILLVVTCVLLAYFYAQSQKQSVGIFRMLGGSKWKSLMAVLLCILLLAVIGAGVGAGAGFALTQTAGEKIMESNLAESEAAATFQAFVLQTNAEAQELQTQPDGNLTAMAASVTLVLPMVMVLIFVLQYINKEPRELLPKSGH